MTNAQTKKCTIVDNDDGRDNTRQRIREQKPNIILIFYWVSFKTLLFFFAGSARLFRSPVIPNNHHRATQANAYAQNSLFKYYRVEQ